MALFRVLHGNRTAEPIPITYLVAGVIGLLLGVASDWLFDWRWWLVAVGFVALVWLFFLSSAFWGPKSRITEDMLRVISPDRAQAREFERLERAVESGDLAAFIVSGWGSEISVGGWGGSPDPNSLTIRHGDPAMDEPWIEVTSRSDAEFAESWLKEHLVLELARGQRRPPDGLPIRELHGWHMRQERQIAKSEPPPWTGSQISIDGRATDSQVARIGEHWAAIARTGDVVVQITARKVDIARVDLERVEDIGPYLRSLGTRRL